MKKIILLMVLIGLPISLVAQEVPDPLTAGYSQCKFLPGKGMESLEEYIELFNEELDKAGIEMSSAMLMPFFKTNISEYDVLWVNTLGKITLKQVKQWIGGFLMPEKNLEMLGQCFATLRFLLISGGWKWLPTEMTLKVKTSVHLITHVI